MELEARKLWFALGGACSSLVVRFVDPRLKEPSDFGAGAWNQWLYWTSHVHVAQSSANKVCSQTTSPWVLSQLALNNQILKRCGVSFASVASECAGVRGSSPWVLCEIV
eukprot:1478535-Amphidinium_carterae.1